MFFSPSRGLGNSPLGSLFVCGLFFPKTTGALHEIVVMAGRRHLWALITYSSCFRPENLLRASTYLPHLCLGTYFPRFELNEQLRSITDGLFFSASFSLLFSRSREPVMFCHLPVRHRFLTGLWQWQMIGPEHRMRWPWGCGMACSPPSSAHVSFRPEPIDKCWM